MGRIRKLRFVCFVLFFDYSSYLAWGCEEASYSFYYLKAKSFKTDKHPNSEKKALVCYLLNGFCIQVRWIRALFQFKKKNKEKFKLFEWWIAQLTKAKYPLIYKTLSLEGLRPI